MNDTVLVLHFSPIEMFPPVTNFIDFFQTTGTGKKLLVYTTKGGKGEPYQPSARQVNIRRCGHSQSGRWQRAWSFIAFNTTALMAILLKSPAQVFYYETNSSLPVILARLIFRKKFQLLIHYHEYMSPADYARTRFQSTIHRGEQKLYAKADWISHTNGKRMELFLQDNGLTADKRYQLQPNYPAKSWLSAKLPEPKTNLCKFVYVGSFNFDRFYMPEFLLWLGKSGKEYSLDIFTQSDCTELQTYIETQQLHGAVRIMGFRKYNELPKLLAQYDIGLILYKPLDENVIYNAPNKLFEYLACGLDVWVHPGILGVVEYYQSFSRPRVIPVDFEHMDEINARQLMRVGENRYLPFRENYETTYAKIIELMSVDNKTSHV